VHDGDESLVGRCGGCPDTDHLWAPDPFLAARGATNLGHKTLSVFVSLSSR